MSPLPNARSLIDREQNLENHAVLPGSNAQAKRERCPVRIHRLFALAAAITFLTLPLHAAVTVSHGDPDRFTDAGDRNNDPRKIMLTLERYLKELGDHSLPPQANLKIEVLDLDRAG